MTLRFLQSSDNNKNSEGVHPWRELQTKLHTSGLNIGYDTFKARWDSQDPSDKILHDLVDRFDGHGIVLKTHNPENDMAQGSQKGNEVEKMAKRATKLGK